MKPQKPAYTGNIQAAVLKDPEIVELDLQISEYNKRLEKAQGKKKEFLLYLCTLGLYFPYSAERYKLLCFICFPLVFLLSIFLFPYHIRKAKSLKAKINGLQSNRTELIGVKTQNAFSAKLAEVKAYVLSEDARIPESWYRIIRSSGWAAHPSIDDFPEIIDYINAVDKAEKEVVTIMDDVNHALGYWKRQHLGLDAERLEVMHKIAASLHCFNKLYADAPELFRYKPAKPTPLSECVEKFNAIAGQTVFSLSSDYSGFDKDCLKVYSQVACVARCMLDLEAKIGGPDWYAITPGAKDRLGEAYQALSTMLEAIATLDRECSKQGYDAFPVLRYLAGKIGALVESFNEKATRMEGNEYLTSDFSDEVWTADPAPAPSLTRLVKLPPIIEVTEGLGMKFMTKSMQKAGPDGTTRMWLDLTANPLVMVRCTNATIDMWKKLATALTLRIANAVGPSRVRIHQIDQYDLRAPLPQFADLKCCTRYTGQREIGSFVEEALGRIARAQNAESFFDLVTTTDSRQEINIVVIQNFPAGMGADTLEQLKNIVRNGSRAGYFVMLMVNTDMLAQPDNYIISNNLLRSNIEVSLSNAGALVIDLSKTPVSEQVTDRAVDATVARLKDCENKGNMTFLIREHLGGPDSWWRQSSASEVRIPFGIDKKRHTATLNITQYDGQNAALIFGASGTGKSNALHTIIESAAAMYSPDELEMYLIDFSGVEMPVYTENRLPHITVIAPEAEREFGLSVLKAVFEEACRRQELCSRYGHTDIVNLRAKHPELRMPRLLVIIDEFQQLFSEPNDHITKEAAKYIETIIKVYRKFGINLILATQVIQSVAPYVPDSLIANVIAFNSQYETDMRRLGLAKCPDLKNGECIYTDRAGHPDYNREVKVYFSPEAERPQIIREIAEKGGSPRGADDGCFIFRYNDLPPFDIELPAATDPGMPIEICLGQPIAITREPVRIQLSDLGGDNLLIVGGQRNVARKIAISAPRSVFSSHPDAVLLFVNYIGRFDQLHDLPSRLYGEQEHYTEITDDEDLLEKLRAVKSLIEEKIANRERPVLQTFLVIVGIEYSPAFELTGRRGDTVSEAASLLAYILEKGPMYGYHTLLQIEQTRSLELLGPNILKFFRHRVALQMEESDSRKLIDSTQASLLFNERKPYSVYRALYRDVRNNTTVKFRPYRID